MTEQELLESAAAHARATTKSWDWFLNKVATDKTYAYTTTEWYAAGSDLQRVKGVPPDPPPPPASYLSTVQARIFLADNPLDCLHAPSWMTPVCTADEGYRGLYGPDAIRQLRQHFGRVEAWCDCRDPTHYQTALQMSHDLALDGAWGQCETTAEFDSAYAAGARRMVGKVDASVLDEARLALVASGQVLVTVELYRNVQPNLLPDWRNANAGIGGNTIACYASDREGAVYTSVRSYIDVGLYVPGSDSVYGVGLQPADWADLAG